MIATTPHPDARETAARPAAPAVFPAVPAARDSAASLRSTVAAAAVALALGLAVGVATSFLQTWLPTPFTALANAVAPWLVAPFLVGLRLARGWWGATLLGLLACLAQVPGYYLTADLRGFPVGTTFVLVWTVAAVVGGPVLGAVGRLHRTSTGRLAGLAPATVAAVWLAEAVVTYALVLGYYGEAAVHATIGVVLLVLLARSRGQLRPALVWAVPVLALGAVAFHALTAVTGSGLPIL
ncbi:DUF6518 family protein [Cellulomonas phragmiteti]|uniref:Integral membrane protein n=1 Tax=Cellulomonas phragmiteti TaxID=478780 RepID=A0ABQ4DIW6_9CELL|nr:DUF6518 family protein [Cellulomonas phragmiteti]GIG39297.1 hypothetical protein Cph01nite_10590 [Cellulomonas phragmiteti]